MLHVVTNPIFHLKQEKWLFIAKTHYSPHLLFAKVATNLIRAVDEGGG